MAKEGIFSGLNNLEVYDTFDERFTSYFGLRQKEVEEALKYYELEYDIDKVKQWYDGYNFGGIEIYNPWSIIKYISQLSIILLSLHFPFLAHYEVQSHPPSPALFLSYFL